MLFSRTVTPGYEARPSHPTQPSIGDEIVFFFAFFLRAAIFFGLAMLFFAAFRQALRFVGWLTGADCEPSNVVSVQPGCGETRRGERKGEGKEMGWKNAADAQHYHEDQWGRMRACTAQHYAPPHAPQNAYYVPPQQYAPPSGPPPRPSAGASTPGQPAPPPYQPRDPRVEYNRYHALDPVQDYGATRATHSRSK